MNGPAQAAPLDARIYRRCSPRHVSLVRRRLVSGIAHLAKYCGFTALKLATRPGRYVLAYHRVLTPEEARDEWCHPSIWITPQTFEAQVVHLKEIGRVLPLAALLEDETPSENTFAITFDDAWSDNYRHALPALERHGVRACFFVPTLAVSSGSLFWTERLALQLGQASTAGAAGAIIDTLCIPREARIAASHDGMLALILDCIERIKQFSDVDRERSIEALTRLLKLGEADTSGRVMDWDAIRELRRRGHEIGSHTRTHRILQGIDVPTVDAELSESKAEVEREIGERVRFFCYPNARSDRLSESRVLPCGYERGFRMHNLRLSRAGDPATVPRFSVAEVNGDIPHLDLRFALAAAG